MPMKKNPVIIGGVLVVVLGGLLFVTASMQQAEGLVFVGDTNVACLPNGHQQLAVHIHPVLSITVDGVPETIPANVGVTQTCMAELHTHDATGVIHVETATADRVGQLSFEDFFAVWGAPVVREGYSMVVTVNGEAVESLAEIPLRDGDQVQVAYTRTVQESL